MKRTFQFSRVFVFFSTFSYRQREHGMGSNRCAWAPQTIGQRVAADPAVKRGSRQRVLQQTALCLIRKSSNRSCRLACSFSAYYPRAQFRGSVAQATPSPPPTFTTGRTLTSTSRDIVQIAFFLFDVWHRILPQSEPSVRRSMHATHIAAQTKHFSAGCTEHCDASYLVFP